MINRMKGSFNRILSKVLGRKIEQSYKITDDCGCCACKKCNPSLHKLYLEKYGNLRKAEIVCIKNT